MSLERSQVRRSQRKRHAASLIRKMANWYKCTPRLSEGVTIGPGRANKREYHEALAKVFSCGFVMADRFASRAKL